MRTTLLTCALVVAGLTLGPLSSQSANAQVIVDGQSTGVVINATPLARHAPVRRSYRSEYNPRSRARIVTKQSAINDSQSQPRIMQLTYDQPSTARIVTRDSSYDTIRPGSITVRDDPFRINPYYARRYREYVPYSYRRNYSYSNYGYWAPYYYGLRHYYRTPYYGGYYRGHGFYNRSCDSSSYFRYSGSGLRFFVRF